MEIPYTIISKFTDWNQPPLNEDISMDKRFVFSLFYALVPIERIASDRIPEDIMEFVSGTFDFFTDVFQHIFRKQFENTYNTTYNGQIYKKFSFPVLLKIRCQNNEKRAHAINDYRTEISMKARSSSLFSRKN